MGASTTPTARLKSWVALVLALSSLSLAQVQVFVPTAPTDIFPACAVFCTVLLAAQQQCLVTGTQLASENCFCQNPTLQALYTTPDAICVGECAVPADRTLLQTWFRNFCNAVGQGVDPLTTSLVTSVAPTQSVVVVTLTSTSSSPGATATGSNPSGASGGVERQSWIEGHWRWVVMLAVLVVGLGLLTWLAIWLKRRHRRKVEARRSATSGFPSEAEKRAGARSATPDLWGPHQHMQYTHGFGDGADSSAAGSGGLAALDRRERRSKRDSHRQRDRILEADERAHSAKRHSSKGKSRELLDPEKAMAADRSRSRSQRRAAKRDSSTETDSDHHQQRLREVRGSRLKK